MSDAENHSSWIDSLDFEGAKAVMREVELGDETTTGAADIAVERSVVAKINGSGSRRAFRPRRAAFVGTVSMSFVIVLAFLITFGVGWVGSYYWYQRAMEAEVQARYATYDRAYADIWFDMHKDLSRTLFSEEEKQLEYEAYVSRILNEARKSAEAKVKEIGDDRDSRQF